MFCAKSAKAYEKNAEVIDNQRLLVGRKRARNLLNRKDLDAQRAEMASAREQQAGLSDKHRRE